jgi:hypothetical protein
MRRTRTTTCLLALVGFLLAPAGCKQSDSILLIEVAGPKDLSPLQLSVTVASGSGSEGQNFSVPPMPGDPITLPASFTIALDRAHGAPITVSIDTLDAMQVEFAGTTTQEHIQIGAQTIIPVMLVMVPPPDSPDAGSGASGADGGAGQGGQGGEGGQGGASGQDGASDDGGAMGLDGAAD